MLMRFGVAVLVLVLSVVGLGFRNETQTRDDLAPIAGPDVRPVDLVTASLSRGLTSLRSQQAGFDAGETSRAETRRVADDLFDVNEMARRALGPHWKGLLPREQDDFIRLFSDVLVQLFVRILHQHTGGDVPSLDEEVAGTFARVRARITPVSGAIALEYRLSRTGSQWRIYDLVFDGVSLASSYRSQVNSIVGTSAASQLLERLRTEASRRSRAREAVLSATTAELEASARARLAAGLLIAAAYARWR
jgi:phospholipid transport system substrate-binding protein